MIFSLRSTLFVMLAEVLIELVNDPPLSHQMQPGRQRGRGHRQRPPGTQVPAEVERPPGPGGRGGVRLQRGRARHRPPPRRTTPLGGEGGDQRQAKYDTHNISTIQHNASKYVVHWPRSPGVQCFPFLFSYLRYWGGKFHVHKFLPGFLFQEISALQLLGKGVSHLHGPRPDITSAVMLSDAGDTEGAWGLGQETSGGDVWLYRGRLAQLVRAWC